MYINSNNIIRWIGAFNRSRFDLSASSGSATFFTNQDSLTFDPLSTIHATASLGLDYNSFKIIGIRDLATGDLIDLSKASYYDGSLLTIYRPFDLTITTIIIEFSFSDYSGNIWDSRYSNISGSYATLEVVFTAVTVKWIEYPVSAMCTLDFFGQNNGLKAFGQLKLVNAITLADIAPLQLKQNIISDPDYVPPVTDLITCPVPSGGVYASLFIGNFSFNPANIPTCYITITQITLASTLFGGVLFTIPCNITPGNTQRFNIPAILYDTGITIQYVVTGDMITPTPTSPVLWRSQVNGFTDNFPTGGTHLVDNSGIYGSISINVGTNGITIFAQ